MTVTEYIKGKQTEWRFHSNASHNKVLGKALWKKIMDHVGLFEPACRQKLILIRVHQLSMETDEAWFLYVGAVARECPPMVKEQRLPWLIDELHRRVPT